MLIELVQAPPEIIAALSRDLVDAPGVGRRLTTNRSACSRCRFARQNCAVRVIRTNCCRWKQWARSAGRKSASGNSRLAGSARDMHCSGLDTNRRPCWPCLTGARHGPMVRPAASRTAPDLPAQSWRGRQASGPLGWMWKSPAPSMNISGPGVLNAGERAWLQTCAAPDRRLWATVIFSAKEAFYKCQYPVTAQWLEFEDAHVQLGQLPPSSMASSAIFPISVASSRASLSGKGQVVAGYVCTAFSWS